MSDLIKVSFNVKSLDKSNLEVVRDILKMLSEYESIGKLPNVSDVDLCRFVDMTIEKGEAYQTTHWQTIDKNGNDVTNIKDPKEV